MKLVLTLLFCLVCNGLLAQTYGSRVLANIASKLPAELLAAASAPGIHDCGLYKGNTVTVCVDDEGCITHIGYKLFAPEIKTLYPSDVYNFLERFSLDMVLEDDLYEYEQKQKDYNVHIVTGSMESFKRIKPELPFSTDRVDDMGYSVAWNDNGKEILNIFFPINYELLLGMPKVEIEKKMHYLIQSASKKNNVAAPSLQTETESIGGGVYRSIPKVFYEVENLTTTTYYAVTNAGGMKPLFSPLYKEYSAANLFLTDVGSQRNYSLNVVQNLYGGGKDNYQVRLTDWLTYCRTNKLTLYFAVEEEQETALKVLVIARSADLGYNHMLSVTLPNGFMQKDNLSLDAKLNAFIPIHNVKDLYGKDNGAKKKKI